MVWSAPAARDSIEAIAAMQLDTPAGKHIRLGDIATVSVAATRTW